MSAGDKQTLAQAGMDGSMLNPNTIAEICGLNIGRPELYVNGAVRFFVLDSYLVA